MTARQRTICSALAVGLSLLAGFMFIQKNKAQTVSAAIARGDYQRAVALLEAPGLADSKERLLVLGNLYYVGLGVPQDFRRAAKLYEDAAMSGDSASQYNLGLIYHNGMGQPIDKVKAAAWFLLADSGGVNAADTFLRTLSGSLNPNAFQQAHQLKNSLAAAMSDKKEPGPDLHP